MSTLKRLRNISALYDGEFTASEAEWADAKKSAAWATYQIIGDALRANLAGFDLSDGFNARLNARLAACRISP